MIPALQSGKERKPIEPPCEQTQCTPKDNCREIPIQFVQVNSLLNLWWVSYQQEYLLELHHTDWHTALYIYMRSIIISIYITMNLCEPKTKTSHTFFSRTIAKSSTTTTSQETTTWTLQKMVQHWRLWGSEKLPKTATFKWFTSSTARPGIRAGWALQAYKNASKKLEQNLQISETIWKENHVAVKIFDATGWISIFQLIWDASLSVASEGYDWDPQTKNEILLVACYGWRSTLKYDQIHNNPFRTLPGWWYLPKKTPNPCNFQVISGGFPFLNYTPWNQHNPPLKKKLPGPKRKIHLPTVKFSGVNSLLVSGKVLGCVGFGIWHPSWLLKSGYYKLNPVGLLLVYH